MDKCCCLQSVIKIKLSKMLLNVVLIAFNSCYSLPMSSTVLFALWPLTEAEMSLWLSIFCGALVLVWSLGPGFMTDAVSFSVWQLLNLGRESWQLCWTYILTLLILHMVNGYFGKQWRPRWNAAWCSISSGSALFAKINISLQDSN